MNLQANDPSAVFPYVVLPASLPAFRLAQHILIDFEAYEYEVHGKRVPMTLRESQLLSALAEKYRISPRGFLPVRYLVEWMMPNWTDYFDPEQAVSQIASGIRKKWGETPRRPRFLISVRYIGYQLRPEPGNGFVVPCCVERNLNETKPELHDSFREDSF